MMNANQRTAEALAAKPNFARVCLAACGRLLDQLERTKDAVAREFRQAFKANERLLRLALNEAEALAWQTDYPHLLFPVLAQEKVQSAANWEARQQILRKNT